MQIFHRHRRRLRIPLGPTYHMNLLQEPVILRVAKHAGATVKYEDGEVMEDGELELNQRPHALCAPGTTPAR